MLNNIAQKKDDDKISVIPMTYRLDFSSDSVDDSTKLES